MGKRGPRAKPLEAIKLQGGFYRESRHGDRKEANREGMAGIPPAPDDLGAEGARAWEVICREWRTMGGLVEIDAFTLHSFCVTWERYKAAVKDPTSRIENLIETMRKLGNLLGLNPSARSTLGTDSKPKTVPQRKRA